ncbi:hypothetical protein B5S28_g3565 [[Candida] boidinii]|nr:hypothetical protein B5S28_g3565 [[Candida] boidinii]
MFKMSTSSTGKLLKNEIRNKLSENLSKLTNESIINQSNKILNNLKNLNEFNKNNKISIYMNMDGSEVKTLEIIKYLFNKNSTTTTSPSSVYLPHIINLNKLNDFKRFEKQKSCLHMLKVESIDEVLNLKPKGKYKLLEPDFKYDSNNNIINDALITNNNNNNNNSELSLGLDLILLPGVAFTKNCYRLGHGVGFYDDYIKRHTEITGKRPILIGISLNEQIIDDDILTLEEHDERLDFVVSPDAIYKRK